MQTISQQDQSIQSLEDILKKPTGKEFQRLNRLGLSIEEAYWLANRQEVADRGAAAARAAAINGMANRQHLNPINPNGGDSRMELTAEQISAFREFNPRATMEEIRKAYEAEQ